MECALVVWKMPYLSKGGRLTLIKRMLSSLPTYFMLLFKMPICIGNRSETLQRDFLWGNMKVAGKLHLVDWGTVCSPLKKRGLGII